MRCWDSERITGNDKGVNCSFSLFFVCNAFILCYFNSKRKGLELIDSCWFLFDMLMNECWKTQNAYVNLSYFIQFFSILVIEKPSGKSRMKIDGNCFAFTALVLEFFRYVTQPWLFYSKNHLFVLTKPVCFCSVILRVWKIELSLYPWNVRSRQS